MSSSTAILSEIGAADRRYSAGAVALHWILAVLLIGQIGLGWYMGELEDHSPAQRSFEAIHISLGLTILLLTVARIAWRLVHRPPPAPPSIARWENTAAHVVHGLFYVMLLALPISGWVMESVGPRPIPFWGLAWPHFPAMDLITGGADPRSLKKTLEGVHGSVLVWTTIVLLGLHVAGAIKHQFDGHPILWRMAGWMKPADR